MLSLTSQDRSRVFDVFKQELAGITAHLKNDLMLYAVIALAVASTCLFAWLNGYSNKISLFAYMYAMKWVVLLSLLFASAVYFVVLIARREKRPLLCFLKQLKLLYIYRHRLIAIGLLLTAISTFISSFSTMKGLIPLIHPFAYDAVFHQMDSWLFAGHEPWQLVHSMLDSPYCTLVINFLYNLWFFLIWGVLSYFLLTSSSALRTRYLLSWLLCWSILGVIVAMLLSSAGPAFSARLDANNHSYDLLMQLLQKQDSWLKAHGWSGVFALGTQEELWQAYANNKEMLGNGISAMPSMHVSMAVLMALGMSKVNRKLGLLFTCYAGIIFISTFYLGWHYLVDGLVSAPLTYGIWHLSGVILNKIPGRSSSKSLANSTTESP